MVRFYEGADGLKTGHTDAAKYCMAVTSKRGDMRLLAVVLGEETAAIRNSETSALLDYGFNNYKINLLKSKDEVIDEVKLDKADQEKISLVPKKDISVLLKKNEASGDYQYETKLNEFKLPIKKGDVVGKLLIKQNDEVVREEELTTKEDIKKIGFLPLWGNFLKSLFSGI